MASESERDHFNPLQILLLRVRIHIDIETTGAWFVDFSLYLPLSRLRYVFVMQAKVWPIQFIRFIDTANSLCFFFFSHRFRVRGLLKIAFGWRDHLLMVSRKQIECADCEMNIDKIITLIGSFWLCRYACYIVHACSATADDEWVNNFHFDGK